MDMPAGLVTVEDIRDRYHRALTADEERYLPAWISDAWDELMFMSQLRLVERLSAVPPEDGLLPRIRSVILSSVMRRLQNPQGRRQYSYSVDDATVSETLASETITGGWFTADELGKLEPPGYASDAFSIRIDAHIPTVPVPLTAPIDEWYPWEPIGRGL